MAWIGPHCPPHCTFSHGPATLDLFSMSSSADWPGECCLGRVWPPKAGHVGIICTRAKRSVGRAWPEEALVSAASCSQSFLLPLSLSPRVGLPGIHLTWLSGLQSVYERQGIAVMTPTVPGSPKGPFLGLPRGTMRRQKSIGKKRDLHPKTLPLSLQTQPSAPQEFWAPESRPSSCLGILDPSHSPPGVPTRWGQVPSLSPMGSPLNEVGYETFP